MKMAKRRRTFPTWLAEWMEAQKITLWGVADLRSFSTPLDQAGKGFPFAFSWAIPMNPQIMVSMRNGVRPSKKAVN